jgi:crotonobetainyl-CoA:carnitine CoA-transferase CaiB-like acyl-CoA transferase
MPHHAVSELRVLELASVLAGPAAGQFFAELGATVIKVENARSLGDVTRSWKTAGENTDDRSAYFCSVNWGKQSIALDLKTEEARKIVRQLSLQSDIVIASYKSGDAEKLGVDYSELSKDHPGLIYGKITGYGPDNPRVGYDAIVQAEAGFMFLNGEPGGPSLKMPVALIDVIAAHHLKEGLLLALLEKARSGKGSLVEVSLIQAAVASLANQATNYLVANQLPQKQGSAHPNIAPYGEVFHTADGKEILLAVGTDNQFALLINILKISGISKELPLKTNVLRVQNRQLLRELIAPEIRKFEAAALLKELNDNKIPAGLIRNIQEALGMPEVHELLLQSGSIRGIRTFVASPASENFRLLPPPHLGEHTHEILHRLLNFSPSDVQSLFQKRIVA